MFPDTGAGRPRMANNRPCGHHLRWLGILDLLPRPIADLACRPAWIVANRLALVIAARAAARSSNALAMGEPYGRAAPIIALAAI